MWLSWAKLCILLFTVIVFCGERDAASIHRERRKTDRKCGYDVSDI